jgi:hypothetical protein
MNFLAAGHLRLVFATPFSVVWYPNTGEDLAGRLDPNAVLGCGGTCSLNPLIRKIRLKCHLLASYLPVSLMPDIDDIIIHGG